MKEKAAKQGGASTPGNGAGGPRMVVPKIPISGGGAQVQASGARGGRKNHQYASSSGSTR